MLVAQFGKQGHKPVFQDFLTEVQKYDHIVYRHLLKILPLCPDSAIHAYLEVLGNFVEPLRQVQILTELKLDLNQTTSQVFDSMKKFLFQYPKVKDLPKVMDLFTKQLKETKFTEQEIDLIHKFILDSGLHYLSDTNMNVLFEEHQGSVAEQFHLACSVKSVLSSVVSSIREVKTFAQIETLWSRIFVFLSRQSEHLIIIREEMVNLASLTPAIKLSSILLLKSKLSTFKNSSEILWPTSFEEVASTFPQIFSFEKILKDRTQPFDPLVQQ